MEKNLMTVLQSQTEVKYTPLIIFIPCSRVRRGKKPILMSCTYPHSPYTIYRFTPRVIKEDELRQSVVSKHSILFPLVSYSSSKLMQWASISIKGNDKPRANRRNIVGQQLPTLLDVTASVCTPCCMLFKGLLRKV